MTPVDVPLHDIKPPVEVPDHSLIVLSGIGVLAVIIALALLFLIWRYWRERHRVNRRQQAFERLKSVDFADAKQAAYLITEAGRTFAEDSQRTREAYDNLVSKLARYKYRKSVPAIDENTMGYYNIYVEMIDV